MWANTPGKHPVQGKRGDSNRDRSAWRLDRVETTETDELRRVPAQIPRPIEGKFHERSNRNVKWFNRCVTWFSVATTTAPSPVMASRKRSQRWSACAPRDASWSSSRDTRARRFAECFCLLRFVRAGRGGERRPALSARHARREAPRRPPRALCGGLARAPDHASFHGPRHRGSLDAA